MRRIAFIVACGFVLMTALWTPQAAFLQQPAPVPTVNPALGVIDPSEFAPTVDFPAGDEMSHRLQ